MNRPELLHGDARHLPIKDCSVDLIVTSPPYFGLRSYTDNGEHYEAQIGAEATPQEFVDVLIECTCEMMRVLKPGGSLWINLGDKYARTGGVDRKARGSAYGDPGGRAALRLPQHGVPSVRGKSLLGLPWRYALRCIDELGLILRAEVIWSKPNGLPESVTDRVRRSHEQWFHFTLEPRYFAAADEIREEHARTWTPGKAGGHTYEAMKEPGAKDANLTNSTPNPLGKLPGSVWEIATQPLKAPAELGVDHYAAFPMEWPRRIILGWSPVGGTVLDPFGGTGTTALVASMHGRHGISIDASADYCRLAQWRCSDPKQRAYAAGTDPAKVDTPIAGQEAMFNLFGGEVE